MSSSEFEGAVWRKSSFSGNTPGQCVEVAFIGGGRVAMRDSKDPDGPKLVFDQGEWSAFLSGVQAGEFS